jgi:nitrogen fixation NifU-like protein
MMQSFYREIVLDHFQRPRNLRELEDATIQEHINNPLCGDQITVYANLQDDTLEEVSFTGRGCSISQASASMLTEQLTGAGRNEAEEKIQAFLQMMRTEENEDLGELAALKGGHATSPRSERHQATGIRKETITPRLTTKNT